VDVEVEELLLLLVVEFAFVADGDEWRALVVTGTLRCFFRLGVRTGEYIQNSNNKILQHTKIKIKQQQQQQHK
jgi:hypothetical protein